MTDKNTAAARGTVVLALSQGCFFILGYLAVVILAREFGPVTYGVYGVIMSVLVWLEESGRSAIPSAAAKLVAETTDRNADLEYCAFILNLGIFVLLFVLFWGAAPWLASWFGIADGTFLFRVAAIDLPFFGAYTAYRAFYQGRGRFIQLGCSQVFYALTKVVGVLLLIRFDFSVKNALLVNVAATIVGLACLVPGGGLRWQARWRGRIAQLASSAAPMGLYFFVAGLRSSLVLWTLQIMSPASAGNMIGVFVAALNIARVPALVLAAVTTVVLPSVSRAVALNDESLARRYINQALRFGVVLYLPVCLVFMSQPEAIMRWIYSKDFSGGGVILSLLVAAEGIRLVHGILGIALTAAGEARKAAVVIIVSLMPALAMLIFFIAIWGEIGAALSSALIALISTVALGILVWRRFGAFINQRSARNIALAGCLMLLAFALLSSFEVIFFLPSAGGLAAYFISLIASGEITRRDFAAFVPWAKAESYEMSNR